MIDELQIARTAMGWFVIKVVDVAGCFETVGAPWATRELARRYRQYVRDARKAHHMLGVLHEEDDATRRRLSDASDKKWLAAAKKWRAAEGKGVPG
jgi:hypothetical protein